MNFRLEDAIEKYLKITDGFGRPALLSAFGLNQEDTERAFGALDEDYHISRYFHFTHETGDTYRINGFFQTHVTIDAEVESLL